MSELKEELERSKKFELIYPIQDFQEYQSLMELNTFSNTFIQKVISKNNKRYQVKQLFSIMKNQKSQNKTSEKDLFEMFMKGDYSNLANQQKNNQVLIKDTYFFDQLKELVAQNTENSCKMDIEKLFEKCKLNLKDYIISIDQVEIKNKIGYGSSGVVYQGKFKFIDVAIKKIPLAQSSLKQLKHLITEILLLQRLRHPNILSLLGVSIDEQKNLYIITELLSKRSLSNFMHDNKGRVTLEVKLNIIFQIAKGLNYMHTLNPPIMHRDIKPLNIFIGQDLTAKIGDFGLAQEISDEQNIKINTDTISTLGYMSPEALDGIYRIESDIYSFGVLMYEILSEMNFMEKQQFELIKAIVMQKERPSVQQFSNINGLKELIQDCWQDSWQKRPSFEVICQRLIGILDFCLSKKQLIQNDLIFQYIYIYLIMIDNFENQSPKYYYGSYLVFGKFRTNDYLFAIGPHWYVSIFGIVLLSMISGLIFIPIWNLLESYEKILFYVFFGLMMGSYLLTIFFNPGIVPIRENLLEIDPENNISYQCKICKIPKNEIKVTHCTDCKICIQELDHHCVWTGKCIGKKNLKIFYVFIASVPAFFIFIMFISMMISNRKLETIHQEQLINSKFLKNI